MILRVSVLLFVCGCTLSRTDPRIEATLEHPSSSLTNAGRIPYVPPGIFTVSATATIKDPDASIVSRSAIRASLVVNKAEVIPGSTASATMTLLPTGAAGVFAGAAMLAWPPGGDVPVHAIIEGTAFDLTVPVDSPVLVIASSLGSQNGTSATVPMCVESSTVNGALSIHLEGATVIGSSGSSATDPSLTLTAGGCDSALTIFTPSDSKIEVRSHAPLTVSTSMPQFMLSAAMPNTASGALPLATIPLSMIQAVPIQSQQVQVKFTAPTSGSAIAAGSVVTLSVHARTAANTDASRVSVVFQSSPEIAIVPTMVTTNSMGDAAAQFAMPNLAGGSLVLAAIGGTSGDTISLHN